MSRARPQARQNCNENVIYVTTGSYFTGNQLFHDIKSEGCFNFPAAFQDAITSIATLGNTQCFLYQFSDSIAAVRNLVLTQFTGSWTVTMAHYWYQMILR